jgi:predicted nucleic acid-binding protein
MRSEPAALPILRSVLSLLYQKPVSDPVLDTAAALPGPSLRSLDAIHLATAEALLPALTWFVAYDKRLADAARGRGLPMVAPA